MKNVDSKIQTDLIILDFSKAFDTVHVPHRKLLHKLNQYGIDGNLLKWISAFLTKREQRVIVEGEFSSSVTVDSGVPQGTVLGPLLFVIHINDLPGVVSSQVRLFADDCLLYRPINSQKDHDILQQDLKNLKTWAENWRMRFNAKKCYILSIKQKSIKLFLKWPHIRTSQKQPILRHSNFRGHEVVNTHQQHCKKKPVQPWAS
jgi:hypothetical protein